LRSPHLAPEEKFSALCPLKNIPPGNVKKFVKVVKSLTMTSSSIRIKVFLEILIIV